MRPNRQLEALKAEAKKQEEKYDWLSATNFYRKALSETLSSNDLRQAGEILERIAFCHRRAAMQCQTQKQFKTSMQMAMKAYKEANEIYQKIKGWERTAKINHSKAMASYVNYWLVTKASKKREILDNCWKLEKEALKTYEEAGDKLNYGKVCNDLLEYLLDRFEIEQDWVNRSEILTEGQDYGEEAINNFHELGDNYELTRAYYLTGLLYFWATHYGELEKRKRLSERSLTYLKRALELSEKIEDRYLIAMSNLAAVYYEFWIMGDLKLSHKRAEKVLRQGLKIKDNVLIGEALYWLADITYWKRWTEEDPDKKREIYENALEYANQAASHLDKISSYAFMGQTHWPLVESLASMAREVKTDRKEKRVLLERAIKAGRKAAKSANRSENPESIAYIALALSKALHFLSSIETKTSERESLLKEALKYARKNVKVAQQAFPFWYWYRGACYNYQASIMSELARIEIDDKKKRGLLEKAAQNMERCIKFCTEWTKFYAQTRFFAPLGRYYDGFGKILNQLFQLTEETKNLQKMIDVYQGAVETYKNADMPSRLAETRWHIAKIYDQLGEYLESAENFELASNNYRHMAVKVPQLKEFCLEYASYMDAWTELEKARYAHENEDYAQSTEHYQKCSQHLKATKKWSYLTSYYSAWSLLEQGEGLSKQDKPQDAIRAFKEAGTVFEESIKILRQKVEKLESSEERDESSKLATIARLRGKYCRGRVLMEEARVLNRKGNRPLSAKKYASARRIFEEIIPYLERQRARRELEFAACLCRAWEKMEQAEDKMDVALYKEAASIFAKAKKISWKRRAGLIAMGNSCFCKALELGINFKVTSNVNLYAGAKLQLENAADYYQKAGFEKAAFWAKATKRLFDAYVYIGKAEAEADPEKRARFYKVAEKCLKLSANLYGRARHLSRQREILLSLERVKDERQLALSLSEVLKAPSLISGTAGISMPDSTEKAAGLNDFESVNIQARLSVPKDFIPGQNIQLRLDLVNVGKKHGLLVRVEGLVPPGAKAVVEPPIYSLENGSLNMRGKRLEPLAVESVNVKAQVEDMVTISLMPRVVYVDELGNFRTHQVKMVKIHPVVDFESETARRVFDYLINAFTQDFRTRSMSIERSGWRSLPHIIEGAKVSKASLYGVSGRVGPVLSELKKKGLIDLTVFHGQRGRGGHILKARICYEKESVKRYVQEKGIEIPA
jgi:tetratricopeptide (TPR) repeat protein